LHGSGDLNQHLSRDGVLSGRRRELWLQVGDGLTALPNDRAGLRRDFRYFRAIRNDDATAAADALEVSELKFLRFTVGVTFKCLTFPQARAFVQEIFTGLLFISRPQYMRWMREAEQRLHQLRI
jgi:hypothetical protein